MAYIEECVTRVKAIARITVFLKIKLRRGVGPGRLDGDFSGASDCDLRIHN